MDKWIDIILRPAIIRKIIEDNKIKWDFKNAAVTS